jgi:long-chain fatty acid transport protein
MKKILPVLCLLGILFSSTLACAGSIDYLSNQSAEYLMTFSRNAATDSADIASYNPAGIVFLPKNGLYLNASGQYIFKPYEQTYRGETYKQDEPTILPNLYAVYKQDAWAAFFAATVPAGGGRIKWKDGTATTAGLILQTAGLAAGEGGGTGATTINSQDLEASSWYVGLTPGVAYKVNEWISLALSGRYIIAKRSASAFADFTMDAVGAVPVNETSVVIDSDFDYTARGWGGIAGIDVRPMEELMLGVRYETATRLDFKYSVNSRSATVAGPVPLLNQTVSSGLLANLSSLDKDGQEHRYDLPALLGLGANYTLKPGLDVMSSFNYYFIKNADWEWVSGYHNGWELSLGGTFMVMPELKVGAGYLYTVSGETESTPFKAENPHLDSWTVGLGGAHAALPNFDVTLAGARTQYLTDSNNEGTADEIRFKKVVYGIALGVQYRFDL